MGSVDETHKVKKIKVPAHPVKKVKQVKVPVPPPVQTPIPPPPLPIVSDSYPYPNYPQTSEMDYRVRAEEDYARGDYYAALDNYKLALLNNPDDFDLVMAKERLLEMLNQKDEAVESLDQALKLRPNNRELWRTKAQLLLLLYHEKGDHHYKKKSEHAEKTAEDLKAQLIAQGVCPSCNGEINCQKCHGTGSCHECGGTGVYKGVVKCQFCNGSGKCDRCGGSSRCPDCKGTGKLETNECRHCHGNGLCVKCHGTGKHLIGHCRDCDGTGYCRHCMGKGKVVDMPKAEETS